MKKIIVIGGAAAGAKAASKARNLNQENQVQLFTDIDLIAYSLCGLPYYIEGVVDDINKLILRQPQDFINKNIDVFLNSKLQAIYPQQNCVLIDNNHIFYDELILAIGARARIPKIKNIDKKNIFTLRSIKEAIQIKEIMQKSKSVLIIGGGYIALELSEAFIANGLDVEIIESKNRIFSNYDEDFSKMILDLIKSHSKNKLKIHLNEEIDEILINENNEFIGAKTKNNETIKADFCIISCGVEPNIEIAKNAGIKLGITKTIAVDNKMRTNFPNIYACGDCTEKYSIITKQPEYIGLGTIANKEGRVAAINAVNLSSGEVFDGILSSTITKYFNWSISKTGLSYEKSLELSKTINIEPIWVNVTKKDKAGYMPNSCDLTLKLIADKRSGEILGAQAVGQMGTVAQRINTITSALKSRLTIEDLLHLDLPYAPPFSGSIDPILTAAYKLKELSKK